MVDLSTRCQRKLMKAVVWRSGVKEAESLAFYFVIRLRFRVEAYPAAVVRNSTPARCAVLVGTAFFPSPCFGSIDARTLVAFLRDPM